MYNSLIKIVSSFFFIGYTPFIPGTVASLVACCIIFFLKENPPIFLLATLLIIILGFFIGVPAEKVFKKKDAGPIVIDEIAGMFLSLVFLPLEPRVIFSAFLLFRIFDALKVFPAGRLERLSGSQGIMLDDIIAGLYTNLILQIVVRFAL